MPRFLHITPYPLFAYTQHHDAVWKDWVVGDDTTGTSVGRHGAQSMIESQLANMRNALQDLDRTGRLPPSESTAAAMRLAIGETDWPTAGGAEHASISQAKRYYTTLLESMAKPGSESWSRK